ncbi:MAG: DEAD/DEAH box helicase [Saprospiraceae bacterium]|nr:MAG: DEAD/DEAH box helicase [Saprospiraceae bacterium]
MTFQQLNLIEPILRALKEEGYETPTPIQIQSIPHAMQGRDLLACAQTGTGKTAAFAVPILQKLHEQHISSEKPKVIKALILTPTRELAIQIDESFKAYGRHVHLNNLVVFGGVSQNPQVASLRSGVDILVATPGRLLDLMNQGIVSIQHIEIFVLDEADRMLDMGFIHDVRRIIKAVPEKRQTLFFSATMPPEIAKLANDILTNPVKVAVTPISSTVDAIEQAVYFVEKNRKMPLLLHLLKNDDITSALVFTRTKHGANRVARDLTRAGVEASAIHGNKSQTARQSALNSFKKGGIRVLVATDIAARGIDIEELSHVINFDIPNIPETYVHRIGRTGRAGAQGIALSFCQADERAYLKDIQMLIKRTIPVVEASPFPEGEDAGARREEPARAPQRREQRRPERENRNSNPSGLRGTNPKQQESGRRSPTNNNAASAPPKKAAVPQQPANAEKSPKTGDQKRKWSSLFTESSSGKKGFVIKSDRSGNDRKKGAWRPPNRGGKK